MKLYRVVIPGQRPYTMAATSITHAMNFVRHWPSVRVMTIRPHAEDMAHMPLFGLSTADLTRQFLSVN